ncbi:hypothetical protein PLICRDRAFT_529371 [Plicaturopsis crispa FD-325 SS-3]|nr:hypothetical protein PLICRDRAFT_529371 [Plicaturopsis crispa FD-325 SS-3]
MKCNVSGADRGILSEISQLTVARALPVHISRNRATIAHHKEGFLDGLIPNISSEDPCPCPRTCTHLSISNEPQLPNTPLPHSTDAQRRLTREWDVTWRCCRRRVRRTP